MNKLNQTTWLLITIIFAVCLTAYSLSDMAIHPWHVMTELGSDGGKNNYTYLYQSLYGQGIWFDGMNYPYGEHIVYTDGQPLFSVLLSCFKPYVTLPFALGVMWGLISLSYVVSTVFSFKIMRHFGVSPLPALLFAGLITTCTPQVFRLSGHYALAYTCVIPMFFYWTVKYQSLKQLKYTLYIFIMCLVSVFVHPYFAAVALVWAGCYAVGYMIFERARLAARFRDLAPLFGSVLGAFLIFGSVMKLTDRVTDRPTTPYGILVNCAHIRDVVASAYSPFWGYLNEHQLYTRVSTGGEGFSYVGLAVLIATFVSVLLGIYNILKKKTGNNVVKPGGFQAVWLFTAFASLLFSMGVPFIWHLEWMTDYFSVLKQFRTLGRFSWIFYYVITVYGSVVLYTWYARCLANRKPVIAYLLIGSALAIWCAEAKWYVKHDREVASVGYERYDMFVSAKEESWKQFLANHHRTREDFQSILTLRFFEVGSEKLWLGHNEEVSAYAVAMSVKAGIQLHLPIVDVMMSRTSWSQAFKQVKIAGGPYTEKPMLDDLKSDKPFLLLDIDVEPLEPDQKYLLEASDSIGHIYNCYVYACYPSRIKANDKKRADSIRALLPYIGVGDTCIRNTGSWYIEHFNSSKAAPAFFGAGAAPYSPQVFTVLATIPVKPVVDSALYELSCWFLTPADDFKSPCLNVELLDSTGKVISVFDGPAKESTDNHGLWLRDYLLFHIPSRCKSVRLRVVNDPEKSYKVMDELMLRPVDALIISKDDAGNIMVNNHLFQDGVELKGKSQN